MRIKPLLKKWRVWALAIPTFLLILLSILISTLLTPWLQTKLESEVQKQTDGMYNLHLGGLEVSLLRGHLEADSLSLKPNREVWEKKAAADNNPAAKSDAVPGMLLDLQTRSLSISGVNIVGLLFGNAPDVGMVRVQEPLVLITKMRQDTTEQGDTEPLHATVPAIARNLQVDRILVEGGTIRFREGKEAKSDLMSLDDFSLQVKDLRLDSSSFHQDERAYYASSIELETGKAQFMLPDHTYRLQAGTLKASTAAGMLQLNKFKVVPLLRNAQLATLKGEAATTLRVEVPELHLSGVDYATHSRFSNLVAQHVVLHNPSLSAFLDRKNFLQKTNKPLPHDLIQDLKTGLTLSKVEVKNMHVRYEELVPDAVETGIITFQNLYATITNVTNDKNRMSASRPAVVEARTSINGKVPLAVTIRLNLLDPDGYHTIKGTAGPANPVTLNPILEPTTFISVKEGKLQKSNFNIELYRNKASGNLDVRYQNFKVDVLTKDEDTRQSLRKKILSKVANKFVLKSDNPDEGEELRAGDITVVRAKNRSVFNYWKDCLVSGFRTAAGLEGIGEDLTNPER